MNRQEFNERIQKDHEQFKANILELPKEDIFNKGFEISFKTFMTEYLQSEELINDEEKLENLISLENDILDYLFHIYINSDTYFTYEDLCDEIVEIFNETSISKKNN